LFVLRPLRERLSEMNLWLSNGNTSSMLHRDGFNQLNCVVKGTKLWTVVDATHIGQIPFVWEDGDDPLFTRGGVVSFEWESVDFEAYPQLATMPCVQTSIAAPHIV
jgi:lysine-specific demethylase 8